ncbi:MAG: right-handed parallel beta-helix repeat-containing protein, partial [Bacteroidetes bacterium]|nr:right-handed parallel beta-helix repeat-containing protein [Bacteroidota bacterium]
MNNIVQDITHSSVIVRHFGPFNSLTYADNTYYTNAQDSAWFEVDGTNYDFDEWLTLSGETGSSNESIDFVDPDRGVESYMGSLGGSPTFDAFIAEAAQQSKFNWRPEYTANAVNDYIREGFEVQGTEEAQCNDGIDNDNDGLVDWQYDLGCSGPDDTTEEALSRDQEDGWTTFDPSVDTRIIYVSNSTGDNTYSGFAPEWNGTDGPKATIGAGKALIRNGFSDWLLLKRGDVWYENLGGWGGRSGRSQTEPIVIATYGSSIQRPLLKTGTSNGIKFCCGPHANLSLLGIEFYAHTRDPNSPEFTGTDGGKGFTKCCDGGGNLLIEDNMFRYYLTNVIENNNIRNIAIRRNIIADDYSTVSHSQGLFMKSVDGILIEENVFDHNGWNEDVPGAGKTIFNHNIYLQSDNSPNVTVRNNIIARASSHGTQVRPGGRVENNLYIRNPLSFFISSPGGEAIGNVLLEGTDIGDLPRGMALGINNVEYAIVKDNIIAHDMSDPINTRGISLGGLAHNILVENNIVYDWYGASGRGMLTVSSTDPQNITIRNNLLQDPFEASRVINHGPTSFNEIMYADNTYHSINTPDQWFLVGGVNHDFAWWQSNVEPTAVQQEVQFPDPTRSVASYRDFVEGLPDGTSTFDAFMAEARNQSRLNWRPEYTADAVND